MSNKRKSVLDMNGNQARMFFLKAESYSNCSLPKYINIEKGIAEGLRLLPKFVY